jgi:hypothetical protein
MTATLARDQNNQPVSALFPIAAVTVALSGTSQLLAVPANTRFLRVASTGNTWVEFGNSGAVATTASILFPGGVEVFPIAPEVTHIAALQVGASTGFFSINRMK